MNITRQGEKLWLLVKRDSRTNDEIAAGMGIDKSYLPKLYKMENLPAKPLKKALEVFKVPASYFLKATDIPVEVAEPTGLYAPAAEENAKLGGLQAENATLREEVRRLHTMLAQERSTNANLAEALKNLSKRD